MTLTSFATDVGVSGTVDILLMTLLIYSLLVLLKRTRRAALVLTGILIVALIYLMARQFDLLLTVAVLQGFFAIILVALVVIFQEEVRYFFEQVAQWGLGRKMSSKRHEQRCDLAAAVSVGLLVEQRRGSFEQFLRLFGAVADAGHSQFAVLRQRPDHIEKHPGSGRVPEAESVTGHDLEQILRQETAVGR